MVHLEHTQNYSSMPVFPPDVPAGSPTGSSAGESLDLPSWFQEDQHLKKDRPKRFFAIAARLKESRAIRENRIGQLMEELSLACEKAGMVAKISGRPKHINSIFKKMQKKGLLLKEVLDLNGIRMILRDASACYEALDLVHSLWSPLPGLYDDYIQQPKQSGYQSLHTTVRSVHGSCLEVQIRTRDMHWVAESGRAAHWRYKMLEYAQV